MAIIAIVVSIRHTTCVFQRLCSPSSWEISCWAALIVSWAFVTSASSLAASAVWHWNLPERKTRNWSVSLFPSPSPSLPLSLSCSLCSCTFTIHNYYRTMMLNGVTNRQPYLLFFGMRQRKIIFENIFIASWWETHCQDAGMQKKRVTLIYAVPCWPLLDCNHHGPVRFKKGGIYFALRAAVTVNILDDHKMQWQ